MRWISHFSDTCKLWLNSVAFQLAAGNSCYLDFPSFTLYTALKRKLTAIKDRKLTLFTELQHIISMDQG